MGGTEQSQSIGPAGVRRDPSLSVLLPFILRQAQDERQGGAAGSSPCHPLSPLVDW